MKKLFLATAFLFSIVSLAFPLEITPVQDFAFTHSDCEFLLRLDGVESSAVTVATPNFSASLNGDNFRFSSMKKEEFFGEDGRRGTIVHFWYNFSAAGLVKIPSIDVTIRGRRQKIAFRSIQVYENPATIRAEIFADFGGSVSGGFGLAGASSFSARKIPLGEKIVFAVYIRYCVQVLDFKAELPKNSIFKELERYEFLKNPTANHDFNPGAYPLAKFEWQPLSEGEFEIPEITATATNYNGTKEKCTLPKMIFTVVKKGGAETERTASQREDSTIAAAFEDSTADSIDGATSSAGAVGTLLADSTEKSNVATDLSKLATKPNLKKNEVVFKGGAVFAVPEKSSRIVANLDENTIVKIVDETKLYCLIKTGKISGWVSKEQLWTSDKF